MWKHNFSPIYKLSGMKPVMLQLIHLFQFHLTLKYFAQQFLILAKSRNFRGLWRATRQPVAQPRVHGLFIF